MAKKKEKLPLLPDLIRLAVSWAQDDQSGLTGEEEKALLELADILEEFDIEDVSDVYAILRWRANG